MSDISPSDPSQPTPAADPNMLGQVKDVMRRTWAASGTIAFIFGFVSDVLQPLAPLASYLLTASAVLVVVLLVLSALTQKIRSWGLPLAVFAFFLGVFSGVLVMMQQGKAADTGVVAAKVPAVGNLQKTLGIMQKDVELIAAKTTKIDETTTQIDEKTDQILTTVEDMSKSFSALAKQGGVIAEPDTPEEFYHNARIHELGGDYGNARRAYLAYFNFDLDYLDPHLRFQDFLKLQEGRAGARESYNLIANKAKSFVPKYASILLWEREQRITMLKAFIQDRADFAPAYYHLSQEFSQARLGTQSLDDKRNEKENLEQFLALHEQGKFLRWFIDKEMASEWIADAETRLVAVNTTVATSMLENPVSVNWTHSSSGWMGSVIVVEPHLEIFWRTAGEGDYKSLGHMPMRHPATGQPMANSLVTLPTGSEAGEIEVKYTNASGAEMGPFTLPFNPGDSAMANAKMTLGMTKNSWVSFRDWDGKLLVYFSHLLGHRGVLSEIKYGLDKEVPDTNFDFPPFDQPTYAPIDSDTTIYFDVPMDTKFITIQLTYKDGTQSEVVRINR